MPKRKRESGSTSDGAAEKPGRSRHPPHLRGKQIGMFYAARSRKKRDNATTDAVALDESKIQEIQDLIEIYKSSTEATNVPFQMRFKNLIMGTIEERLTDSVSKITRNPLLDKQLLLESKSRQQDPHFDQLLRKRKTLPSYAERNEILKLIEANQVVVISGETGCGKTTQVAQFILDDFIAKEDGSLCHIVCTQPRRISAISVAERVAVERIEKLGRSVGYNIRLDKLIPRDKGSMVFCTTGIVLKQMEEDPYLSRVSHVILDEIHERDVMSDFIITLLKEVLSKRNDLKLILMSATLNADKFSGYYNNCPHINIPGVTYPVEEYYLEDALERTKFVIPTPLRAEKKKCKFQEQCMKPYVDQLESDRKYSSHVLRQLRNPLVEDLHLNLVLALIEDICAKESDQGAILVFLTGFSDISSLHKRLEQSGSFPSNRFIIICLHSMMPTINQRQVFERPPDGIRKIVLSTNIAETSITIDDVVFVIDCGKIKLTNFNVSSNTNTINPEWVSLANASQRKGRAGRVQPGKCYHLFTRARKTMLEEYQKPEVLRTRLENTILTLKILQLGKAEYFLGRLMDAPQPDAIAVSLSLLKRLNAIDEDEVLTPLGYHLARLPIAPQLGKMIVLASIFNCVDPILSVAAALDYKDPFQTPLGKEREVAVKKLELSEDPESDHVLLIKALCSYETKSHYAAKQFCWNYFLSWHTLSQLKNMKGQFMEYLYEARFVNSKDPKDPSSNANSKNVKLLKTIICAGLYPNIGAYINKKRLFTMEKEKIKFHPKSILVDVRRHVSCFFAYYIKLKSSSDFVHDATLVSPLSLILFGDDYKYAEDETAYGAVSFGSVDLTVPCSPAVFKIVEELRGGLAKFFDHKMSNPGIVEWNRNEQETAILRAAIALINEN